MDQLCKALNMPTITDYGYIKKPYVSIIIPVYNEEQSIQDCVHSLRNQNFSPLEIIAVDDGSIDSSVSICMDFGIDVYLQEHRGPGAARNLGARNAKGNILVLIDADMTFEPDYIQKLILPIINNEAIATCHWHEGVANWDNPWARCQTWFLGNPDGRRQPFKMPEKEYVYRAVRKDFFLNSGGFAEDEGKGDDASISRRTGIFAVMVPDATCYHRNIEGPGEIYREALWDGRHVAFAREHRFRRCLAAALVYHNPFREILRGIWLSFIKKEPRMVAYSAIYSVSFVFGMLRAAYSGFYQK